MLLLKIKSPLLVVNWFQIVSLCEESQVRISLSFYIKYCELISNCIFMWGITSTEQELHSWLELWIDFKLYLYVRNHKNIGSILVNFTVVNWFQIVSLCEESQVYHFFMFYVSGCELISNCIFMWGITRMMMINEVFSTLWIDFKLYLYVRNHKSKINSYIKGSVVNWFQIVSLCEESQEELGIRFPVASCELISNCIFMWGITRRIKSALNIKALWIDFKLYLYVRNHKGSI